MVNSALESGQLLQSCITVVCPELYQESGQLIQNAVDAQPWMALRHSKTPRLPWNAMPEISGMKRAEFAPSEHQEEYNTLCAMLEGSGLLREFDIESVVLCHDRARANKLFSQRKDLLHKLDFKANSRAFASRMLSGTEEDRNFRKTVLAEFTQRFEDKKHKKHCSLETDGGAGVALAFHAPSSAENAELILQGEPAHTCQSERPSHVLTCFVALQATLPTCRSSMTATLASRSTSPLMRPMVSQSTLVTSTAMPGLALEVTPSPC
jgi:hypothetical protein